MKIYTAIEAATKTSIPKRTIQYKCKRDNIRKKLNVYQITDDVLNKWIEEDVNSPRKSSISRAIAQSPLETDKKDKFIRGLENELKDLKGEAALTTGKQEKRIKELEEELKMNVAILEKYEVELEELDVAKVEIIRLEKDVKEWEEYKLEDYLPEIEDIPLEQLEAFPFDFNRDGKEPKKGNLLFVPKDMISVIYTSEDFDNLKLTLENSKLLELKIEHLKELHAANLEKAEQAEKNKDKLHDSKVKNKDEVHAMELEKAKESELHYKNIYFYTRKQAADITRIHEKTIEVVMLSGKENMIKTVKDAKNTEWKK
jgi:hypothetical protein